MILKVHVAIHVLCTWVEIKKKKYIYIYIYIYIFWFKTELGSDALFPK